ncbi:MAG: hypothetical protein K2Y28_02705 [Burkholderiaceae bacterium]|nr:hypothetical protein [Burkholderiaceae bacterium]
MQSNARPKFAWKSAPGGLYTKHRSQQSIAEAEFGRAVSGAKVSNLRLSFFLH